MAYAYLFWLAYWVQIYSYNNMMMEEMTGIRRDLNTQKERINQHERRMLSQGI